MTSSYPPFKRCVVIQRGVHGYLTTTDFHTTRCYVIIAQIYNNTYIFVLRKKIEIDSPLFIQLVVISRVVIFRFDCISSAVSPFLFFNIRIWEPGGGGVNRTYTRRCTAAGPPARRSRTGTGLRCTNRRYRTCQRSCRT